MEIGFYLTVGFHSSTAGFMLLQTSSLSIIWRKSLEIKELGNAFDFNAEDPFYDEKDSHDIQPSLNANIAESLEINELGNDLDAGDQLHDQKDLFTVAKTPEIKEDPAKVAEIFE